MRGVVAHATTPFFLPLSCLYFSEIRCFANVLITCLPLVIFQKSHFSFSPNFRCDIWRLRIGLTLRSGLIINALTIRFADGQGINWFLLHPIPFSSKGDNYKLHHLISSLEFMALIIGHRMKGKNPFLFANPALLDAHITHHTIPLLAHDALQTTGQCCCQIDL